MKTGKIKCTPVTFGGDTHPGSNYSKFREKIRANIKSKKIEGEVDVRIKLFITQKKANRSDLDNYLKAIIDGISNFKDKWAVNMKKGVIHGESQIKSILIERKISDEEGVIVEVR